MRSRNTRRGPLACTSAALLSAVFPGLGHLAVRARFRPAAVAAVALNVLATAAALAIAGSARTRTDVAALVADRFTFLVLAAALATLAVTRLATAADAAWQARPRHGSALRLAAGTAIAALVLACVAPLAVATNYVLQTDRAVGQVFGTHDAITAYPGALPEPGSGSRHATTTTGPATFTIPSAIPATVPPPAPTTTTLPPIVGEDRVNVLLLGGDAGPGRWSLRTDSIIVVSIHPATGDTVMISVPRNLTRLPFPPGSALATRYPNGFNDLANAVYPAVDRHRELAGGGDDAAAQAVKLGIAQLLGMPIHHYVLVDMAGFVDVVDALGGLQLNVATRLPMPGNPAGAAHPVPDFIEPGPQHMDGTIALAFARSRTGDSDYKRMGRQRCVLGAIAAAATPLAIVSGLGELVGAFGDAVRTDIPRERLGEFSDLIDRFTIAGGTATVRTLHLAPPLVSATRWDAVQVRQLVAGLLGPDASAGDVSPATPAPDTPATTTGPPAAPAPVPPAPSLADGC